MKEENTKPGSNGYPFVRPEGVMDREELLTSRSSGLVYDNGVLYRLDEEAKLTPINESLPVAEWYEVVEIAQSPVDRNVIWLAIGGKELFFSNDGGRSFVSMPQIAMVADISFIPWLRGESDYVLCLMGALKNGQKGAFISQDSGNSWITYDLDDQLPLA